MWEEAVGTTSRPDSSASLITRLSLSLLSSRLAGCGAPGGLRGGVEHRGFLSWSANELHAADSSRLRGPGFLTAEPETGMEVSGGP